MLHGSYKQFKGTMSPEAKSFFETLERLSFICRYQNAESKTFNVIFEHNKYGYCNESVYRRQGIVGYHFAKHGRDADACPSDLRDKLVKHFCKEYECPESCFVTHSEGQKSGDVETYLIVKDRDVALRMLLNDAGIENKHVVEIGEKFVEGRLVEVTMQLRERDRAARQKCLEAHGFDCHVCTVNLKKLYVGLAVEMIHVHHENPLSEAGGEREFDPVATMKPVCPNCHCVIHSKTPPFEIDEVRQMLNRKP